MYRWIVALIIILMAMPAGATTYYVAQAPTTPATSCTQAQNIATPHDTIAEGVACMIKGDTLYLRGGTYPGSRVSIVGKVGDSTNRFTVSGYQTETVTLVPSGIDASNNRCFTISGSQYITLKNITCLGTNITVIDTGASSNWIESSSNLLIENIEVNGGSVNSFFLSDGASQANITFRNCRLHDSKFSGASGTRGYAVYAKNTVNLVIENNDIYNQPGGGLQIYPGPHNGVTIRNNRIHDNNQEPSIPVGGLVVARQGAVILSNVQVYNNLVYNNGSSPTSGTAPGMRLEGFDGAKVWNNTVYGNKGNGIEVDAFGANVASNGLVQNNIVTGNTGTAVIMTGAGHVKSHNACTLAEVCTDSSKVTITGLTHCTVSTTDFHLKATAPCIDMGTPVPTVSTDFDGVPRPKGAGYDIGAYEYATVDTTAPAAPTGLTLH